MLKFGFRYATLLLCVLLLFAMFVACGAQLYQISLKEDVRTQQIPPEATDPSSGSYGLHAPHGWKNLPIHFKVGQGLTPDQKAGLTRAMSTWEQGVGQNLFVFEGVHEGIDGDSFTDLYSSLNDHINGHYLDFHWDKTGKASIVLATTIWNNFATDIKAIDTADIRFNRNYYTLGDSLKLIAEDGKEVVDMETLALHELGHLLGLAHINPAVDGYSIMTASLYIGEGLSNRRLSRGDYERVQKIYGCQGVSCNIDGLIASYEPTVIDKKDVKQVEPIR